MYCLLLYWCVYAVSFLITSNCDYCVCYIPSIKGLAKGGEASGGFSGGVAKKLSLQGRGDRSFYCYYKMAQLRGPNCVSLLPFVTKWLHYSNSKELALEFRAKTGFCAPAHALSTCRHATWLAYRNSYYSSLYILYILAKYIYKMLKS